MTKLVTFTMTDGEALDVRMALNAAAMDWGDRARDARERGKVQAAQSCERIRAEYGALWDRLYVAEHGVPFDYRSQAEKEATAAFDPAPDSPPRLDFVNCRGE
jgi:hypothetical protein